MTKKYESDLREYIRRLEEHLNNFRASGRDVLKQRQQAQSSATEPAALSSNQNLTLVLQEASVTQIVTQEEESDLGSIKSADEEHSNVSQQQDLASDQDGLVVVNQTFSASKVDKKERDLRSNLARVHREKQQLEVENQDLRMELEALRAELKAKNSVESENQKLRAEMSAKQDELEKLLLKMAELHSRISQTQRDEQSKSDQKISKLQTQMQQLEEEKIRIGDTDNKKLSRLTNRLSRLESELLKQRDKGHDLTRQLGESERVRDMYRQYWSAQNQSINDFPTMFKESENAITGLREQAILHPDYQAFLGEYNKLYAYSSTLYQQYIELVQKHQHLLVSLSEKDLSGQQISTSSSVKSLSTQDNSEQQAPKLPNKKTKPSRGNQNLKVENMRQQSAGDSARGMDS